MGSSKTTSSEETARIEFNTEDLRQALNEHGRVTECMKKMTRAEDGLREAIDEAVEIDPDDPKFIKGLKRIQDQQAMQGVAPAIAERMEKKADRLERKIADMIPAAEAAVRGLLVPEWEESRAKIVRLIAPHYTRKNDHGLNEIAQESDAAKDLHASIRKLNFIVNEAGSDPVKAGARLLTFLDFVKANGTAVGATFDTAA